MTLLPIERRRAVIGFSWRQLGLLAGFGVVIGLLLALTISVPVS